ncbi:hypothetical protein B0T22DRAFT_455301 [Podospora appendiculata]|uniref:Casein kinase II beta 2 subunit n=1 Tax=Podospora appendiculata TaxID=314037 RepID=A0AAE0XLI0_9PEZI|nr:hypothetical protein B0T22DRAFT_455301 [Podospora appendiculata]
MSPLAGGMWATAALRLLAKNMAQTSKMLRSKLAEAASRPFNAELQPITIRSASNRQPIHPAAVLRQQRRNTAKWYSTGTYTNLHGAVRRYLSTAGQPPASKFDRSKLPISTTSRAVAQFTGRAPFASTLRPNLTGGALPRTAGGYAIPGAGRTGGARYFSHTPAAQAQVVQNVSQAMRAFWLSGHRAHFDGTGPNGEKRYRAVSAAQEEARLLLARAPRVAPGSFLDFHISPTVTALSPLGVAFPFATAEGFGASFEPEVGAATLHTDGFLDVLSVDFARALKDLAAVMTDLKKLSGLGDLPITLEKNSTLRVRFPGVDAETVERLCDDVGVQRGVVGQDADFDESAGVSVALRFPYAPDALCAKTITSPGVSVRTHDSESSGMEDAFLDEFEENPWMSSAELEEGYESMSPPILGSSSGEHCSSEDFEGLEGIYRFLEECDRARGQF